MAKNPLLPPTSTVSFNWEDALDSIKEFNSSIKNLEYYEDDRFVNYDPEEVLVDYYRNTYGGIKTILERLVTSSGGSTGCAGNPAAGQHLGFWINQNFGYKVYKNIQDLHQICALIAKKLLDYMEAPTIRGVSVGAYATLSEENQKKVANYFRSQLLNILDLMREYAKEINKLLEQIYPDTFTYAGFKITNPNHFAKPLVNDLLAGIDYLKTTFKNKGLLPIFETGIKSFELAFQAVHESWHGLYIAEKQKIIIYHVAKDNPSGRLLKDWVSEVFLHEFGHYIHLNYIHAIAKDFWDSYWDLIIKAKSVNRSSTPITPEEREYFFRLLQDNEYTPWKVLKQPDYGNRFDFSSAILKYRFIFWLNNPSKGYKNKLTSGLDFTKAPELTKLGKDLFSYFQDPYEYMEKYYPEYLPGIKDKPGTLGLRYDKKTEEIEREFYEILGIKSKKVIWPIFYPQASKEIHTLAAKSLSMESQFIKEILNLQNFGIPSEYGTTNEKEDFSETFVSFVTNPRALSPLAQYRMKRTLSLSGLYGKPVMHFAEVIEKLLVHGEEKHAKEILESYLKQ